MKVFMKICSVVLACYTGSAIAQDKKMDTAAAVTVRADHPNFTVKLISNPSTGYSWSLVSYDTKLVFPQGHHYVRQSNRKLVGAPGMEYWTFSLSSKAFEAPYKTRLVFVYKRPWEKQKPVKEQAFLISTAALKS
jgi:predicted secreted protein